MELLMAIFFLLVIFQIKHFLADYPLQNKYMLGKFKDGFDWIHPLAAHCFVHAFMTLIICFLISPSDWWLAIVDFCIHFLMDRIKAWKLLLGRFKPEQPYFWWALGFDQMVHHLTHYFIIFALLTH